MANIPIITGVGGTAFLSASGGGTDGDPYVPTQAMAGTVATTQSGAWNVGGTVQISNLPTTQTVAGTVNVGNFPATQPVSGTVGLAPISWTNFHYTGTASGPGTVIVAPGAGSALWFEEIAAISGQTIDNTLLLKAGTVTRKTIPTATKMDGIVLVYPYPDYIKFPANTPFVVDASAAGTVFSFGRYCIQPG